MDLKTPGSFLYLVGDHQPTWGGSHFSMLYGLPENAAPEARAVPFPPVGTAALYASLHQAIRQDQVCAVHDLSEGGLAVAAAEMGLAGRLGLKLELLPGVPLLTLFGETNGCLLTEVRPTEAPAFEEQMAGLPVTRIGQIRADPFLVVHQQGRELLTVPLSSLFWAWRPGQVAEDAEDVEGTGDDCVVHRSCIERRSRPAATLD